MSLPDRTTILIIGAGPAGLAAALSLVHYGIQDFTIVDAASSRQNTSRAIIVHAATLEALDTIGCGDDIISRGAKCTAFNVGLQNLLDLTSRVSNHTLGHPYLLVIPQNFTERTLEEKLRSFGVTVHRPLRVVGLRRSMPNPQLSDVTFEDGRVIATKYVIGADGARSVVRTMAGIGFSDPIVQGDTDSSLAQMILADVTFDNVDPDDLTLRITLSPNRFFISFALPPTVKEHLVSEGKISPSGNIFRVGCGARVVDSLQRLVLDQGLPSVPVDSCVVDSIVGSDCDDKPSLDVETNPASTNSRRPRRLD